MDRRLGRPDRTTQTRVSLHPKHVYRGGKIEIVFVDGKADWIILYDTAGLTFDKWALPKLGLPVHRPTYTNRPSVISWTNIANIQEVSLFGNESGRVSYALIVVRTKQHGD